VPTNPTLRLERILLLAWTVALAMLVVFEIGSIPPSLAWALLPYLGMVARHLIAPTGRKTEDPRPAPAEVSETPAGITGPEVVGSPPDPGPGPERIEPEPRPIPARPSTARPRRKARPRVVAEPVPAAWVQVAPGRFVRGEQPEPTPPPPPEAPESSPPEPPVEIEPSEVASESTSQPGE
jgi:hypothetical protein